MLKLAPSREKRRERGRSGVRAMQMVKASRGSDPNAARGDKARAKKEKGRRERGSGLSSYSYQFASCLRESVPRQVERK